MENRYDIRKLKKQLRDLWVSSALTQKQLAAEIGINDKTLNNMLNPDSVNLNGKPIVPDTETLVRLCNYYDCDIDALFGNLDYSKHDLKYICEYTGLQETAIENLKRLNRPQKQILDYILTRSDLLDHIEQYIDVSSGTDSILSDPDIPDSIKIAGIDITQDVLKQAVLNLIRTDLDLVDVILTLDFDDTIEIRETNVKSR